MRLAGRVAWMGEMRNACKILVRKPEGMRPLRRCRHTWEDNIRMDLRGSRVGKCGLGAPGSEKGPVLRSYEHLQ